MWRLATTALFATVLLASAVQAQDLIVQSVMPRTLSVQQGDRLLAWIDGSGSETRRPLTHPLQLDKLHQRAIAGETITLLLERAGEERRAVLPAAEWTIRTGFRVDAALDSLDERAAIFDDLGIRAAYLEAVALEFLATWQADNAGAAWSRSLQIRESIPNDELGLAHALQGAGDAALMGRDLDSAVDNLQRSLQIRERLAPGTLATALGRQRLAFVALQRRDLPAMEEHIQAALEISRRVPPQGLIHAESLRGLGIIQSIKGDAAAARGSWLEALAIYRDWAPGSIGESRVLSNVGIAVWQMGDLVAAERYFRSALEIVEELAPGSQPHAGYLNNLGLIYHRRYEFERARIVYEQATEIFESRAPDSLEVARSLTNVALAYGLGGKPGQALERLDRVLDIQLRLQPDSTDVAQTHHAIGLNFERTGDLPAAESSFRTALALRETLLPESQAVAVTAHNLGLVLEGQGNEAEALRQHQRARALFGRLAPGTTQEAQALHALGRIHRDREEIGAALEHFEAAIIAIERQTSRLGGSEEARGNFSARFASFYKDYIELLLRQGDEDRAFRILERYRARMLREMLAERELSLDDRLPVELRDRRRNVSQQYERAAGRLRRLSDTDANAAEIDSILAELNALQSQRETIAALVRSSTPELAAIDARSVGLDAAAQAIGPGTVMLSYCVTPTATYLFAIGDRLPPRVINVDISADDLARQVEEYRLLLQIPDGGSDVFAGLSRHGHRLYELLLDAALADVATGTRLIVIPDGPLHTLPFAALVTELIDDHSPRYLVERHPLHTVLSATLLVAESGEDRTARTDATGQLAAFGDPVFETSADGLGPMHDREFRPLPSSRMEVESIAELFGTRAQLFLGADATEDKVKQVAKDSRYLHIATHGVLDSRFPLDSYLAFTAPENPGSALDNGLLHAWEVLEQFRLDTDLIVMSACETGLGQDVGGEGLLGMSWAFQYAGARSVIASLWSVPDASTATLMSILYRFIEDDVARDEALRRAQLELIGTSTERGLWQRFVAWLAPSDGGASVSHPYYWAAFQVAGMAD